MIRCFISLVALLPLVACSSNTTSSPPPGSVDSGTTDTATTVDAEPISGSCNLSCAGVAECVTSSSQCASGYCLADSTGSYCTRSCDTSPCPAGYECRAVEGIGTADMRACVALAAVCGNNVKERGEACDDGNTASGDGCSADCKKLEEQPPPQEKLAFNLTLTSSNASILASATVTREDLLGPPPSSITCGSDSAQPTIGARGSFSSGGKSGTWESLRLPFCDGASAARVGLTLAYLPGDYVGSNVYGSVYVPTVTVTAVAETSGGVACEVLFAASSSPQTTIHVDAPMSTSIGGRLEADLPVSSVRPKSVFPSSSEEDACRDLASSVSGATVHVKGTFTRSSSLLKF